MPNLTRHIVYPIGMAVLGLILFNAGLYGLLGPVPLTSTPLANSTYRLDFDRGRPDMDGWHPVEKTPDGITFQWTSASPASITFPLQSNGAMEIEFEALQAIEEEMYSELRLTVNNQPVALERLRKHYQGVIPASVLDSHDAITLSFYTPPLIRPADQDPDIMDIRLLGIAFDWLELRPLTP